MSTTPNYGLFVTDDNTTKFNEVRRALYGTSESNMTKIDRVLGEKADCSNLVELVLQASAWTASASAAYEQSIFIENLTAEQNGCLCLSQSADAAERSAARQAFLHVTGQDEGHLTVSADGKLPEIDIHVALLLLG